MRRDERGFTLAETLTALMVFGVVMAAAVPVFLELRAQQQLEGQRFEAMLLLQERMELLQRETAPSHTTGTEERRGETMKGTVYRIAWKKVRRGHLASTDVMVQWKDIQGKNRQLRLKSLQFVSR